MIKKFILPLLICCAAIICTAQIRNTKLLGKAESHFSNKEWEEAFAMYSVLLMEQPTEIELYPPTLIACGKGSESANMMSVVELSEKSGIPLDTLFSTTFSLSKKVGDTNIYRDMLLLVKKHQPWFGKMINGYLLKYYWARKENDNTISIANEILSTSPKNDDVMIIKARALNDAGKIDEAVKEMKQILKTDPNCIEAHLFLGNYYFSIGKAKYDSITANIDYVPDINYKVKLSNAIKDAGVDTLLNLSKSYIALDSTYKRRPFIKNMINDIDRMSDMINLNDISKGDTK